MMKNLPNSIFVMIEWTPADAIKWLRRRRGAAKLGKDYFALTLDVIRQLLADRTDLHTQIAKLEKEIARLQKLKTPVPYDIGGQGKWGLT